MSKIIRPGDFMKEEISRACREYRGVEILDVASRKPITVRDGIKAGDRVLAYCLSGYCEAEIVGDLSGNIYAETATTFFPLEFDIDDRHCWTSSGVINKAAINKIEFKIKL